MISQSLCEFQLGFYRAHDRRQRLSLLLEFSEASRQKRGLWRVHGFTPERKAEAIWPKRTRCSSSICQAPASWTAFGLWSS